MRSILVGVAVLACWSIAPRLHAGDRLNVVVILADDLGWADLGCYGSKYHKTPHLDRFARTGARFTTAYAAAPVCSPTRAALLTGLYPARLNLTDWLPGRGDRPDQKLLRPAINQELPASIQNLAAILKAAGYVTGHIGKWHLGGMGSGPLERGFDVNIAGDHTGSPLSYFAPYQGKGGRFMPGLEKAPKGEYLTDRLTTEAERFIETHRDRPFFLYLAHYTVHIPMRAKADLAAKYQPGRPGEQGNPLYAAMIESLDESMGRILAKLAELKLTGRTLVIFTSDNGGLCVLEGPNTPPTINAPLREGKGWLYEGGLRVPLIMRWDGVARPGSAVPAPVSSIDLMPTILEACGVKPKTTMDGVSLAPALKGMPLQRDALYWHYPHYSNQGGRPGGAVRAGDHMLIEFYENGRRELYDVVKDVGQTRNLIESHADLAKELHTKLASWRQAVDAKMMQPNPDYVPNPPAKDGSITLHAKTATIHGVQLRFEPLPHKNTLGFWTRAEDWAAWEFTATKPGKFTVEVLQGCGQGQGGSTVELAVAAHKLSFVVEDTGHFQNFKLRTVGMISLDRPGRYTLTVRPTRKAAAAVMDLRAVTLKRIAE